MGIYLASPNKEKKSEEGQAGNMRFGASSMQGRPLSARRTYSKHHIIRMES